MSYETRIFSDLYQRIWINEENPFAENDGIRYIKPFEALPENIIVRDEYHAIWDFVKRAYRARASSRGLNVSGGLVLTGQPGIGKTCFLTYALVRALKERLPVSYCVTDNEIVIFNEDGFRRGSPRSEISSPRRTLCLVDSSAGVQTPPGVVLSRIDNYVVQAASPQAQHWREWSKQRLAKKWVMDVWTKGEMENLVRLMGIYGPPDPSRYTPLELFDILGPSPRNCFSFDGTFTKTPKGLQTTLPYGEPAAALFYTGVLRRILETGNCFPLSEQGQHFHYFFFARPAYENPLCDQPQFRYVVPTDFLKRRLSDYVVTREPQEQFRLLCALAPLPQALDLVYEPYIVSHICEITESLPCYLVGNPYSPSFQLGPGLSLERLPVDPGQGMREYRDSTIYVPQSCGASLDAFVISENKTRVTMVHFAVAQNHKLEPSGVCRVIDDLKGKLLNPESVRWTFLFVSPDNRGKVIANANTTSKLSEEYPEIRIGWISTDDDMD